MSTHAKIAITDGTKCRAIYLHWDGYLARAGAILRDYMRPKMMMPHGVPNNWELARTDCCVEQNDF